MTFLSTLAGKLILAGLLLAALIFGVTQCQNARTAKQEARLSDAQAGAASDNAADAIGTAGAVSGRDTQSDDLTERNADEILRSPGADALVDPAVRDAALNSLCRRAAYRDSLKCLQRTAPAGVAAGGAGSRSPAE